MPEPKDEDLTAIEHKDDGHTQRGEHSDSPFETARRRKLLLISPFPADHTALLRLLDDSQWLIKGTPTYRLALGLLCRECVDVVVCETHLPDGTWKDVLSHIAGMLDAPALIVTSTSMVEHLRAEVEKLGGKGVLRKPFRAEEVLLVLDAAQQQKLTGVPVPGPA